MSHKVQNKNIGILFSFFSFIISAFLIFNPAIAADTAGLLANGVQQFFDSNGNPLTSGKVYFYGVGTSTFKDTYTSSAATTINPNPITLNAGGKSPTGGIYGIGTYRQVVKDKNGNLIWDAVTSPTGGGGSTPTNVGDGNLVGTILPWSGLIAPNQYVFAYGQEIARASYPEFYKAITLQSNVVCSASSNILTGLSDTTQIPVGAKVELSLCVISGTTVVSKTSSTVTLSNPSSVSLNAVATFFPYGNGNGTTTFNVPDLRGYTIAGRDNMGGTAIGRLTSTYCTTSGLGAFCGNQSSTLNVVNLPNISSVVDIPAGQGSHAHGTVIYANTQASAGAAAAPPSYVNSSGGTTANATLPAMTGTANFTGSNSPYSIVQPTIQLNYIIKVTPDSPSSSATGVMSLGGMTGVISCGDGLLCTGNIISSTITTPVGANPTATIGLTAINGGNATFMRSDSAPPLSQAIVPIWTGLHTFTTTSGGIEMSGSPNILKGFSGQNDYFGFYSNLTAASATNAEVAGHFGITSSTGATPNAAIAYKMAIATSSTCNSGSGYCWGLNPVVNVGAGGSKRGGVGIEVDMNNAWGNYTGSPVTPYFAGMYITGTNTGGYGSCAVCVEFGGSASPMWNAGLHFGPPGFAQFNTASIWDETNSPTIIRATGSHTQGIDFTGATFAGGSFLLAPNNTYIYEKNTSGTLLAMLGIDTSNRLVLGVSSLAYILANQSVMPGVDATYLLGQSGQRWAVVWAANGIIQTSDRRSKKDINNLPEAIPIVMAVEPKTFHWKSSGDKKRHWGLIAQDVDAAIRKTGVEFGGIDKTDKDQWGLNYAETNAILWKAIREQQIEINKLKVKIK